MDHILSLSYGKDSLACLKAIEELGWPLDRIIHAEVWATDTIPADLLPMVEFKERADKIILERYKIKVEHISASVIVGGVAKKKTYNDLFYKVWGNRSKRRGEIYGFSGIGRNMCNSQLKAQPLDRAKKGCITYLGIAADEPNRFHNLSETKKSPLVELGWTEQMCHDWCVANDLLSPIYKDVCRGGCWFCHNQGVDQLRQLRSNYPRYWDLMLKWDSDSPVKFHPDGHTVHDFDKRFSLEDQGLVPKNRKFRWKMMETHFKEDKK